LDGSDRSAFIGGRRYGSSPVLFATHISAVKIAAPAIVGEVYAFAIRRYLLFA
jgi:hypothetical protein